MINNSMQTTCLFLAVQLKVYRDERLYEELGYSCMRDYVEHHLGMTRGTASNYMLLAETFSPNATIMEGGDVKILDTPEDNERMLDRFAELSSMGMHKLTLIRKLGDGAAQEFADSGSVTLPDGTVVDRDTVSQITAKELSEMVQKHREDRRGWLDEKSRLVSESEKAKSEADATAADLEAMRQQMADLQKEHERLRAQLPEGKQTITDVRRAMSFAYDLLCDASSALKDIPNLASYDDDGLYETARLIQVMVNSLSNSASTLDTGDGLMVDAPDFDFDKAVSELGGTPSIGVGGDGQ